MRAAFSGVGLDAVSGLALCAVWLLAVIVIGFANMNSGPLSRLRGRVARIYDEFKMETKRKAVQQRQSAYRLEVGRFETLEDYDKRQADIRVCTEVKDTRCLLAASDSLTHWLGEVLSRSSAEDRKMFVDEIMTVIVRQQKKLSQRADPTGQR
jgi:hypothetical protein